MVPPILNRIAALVRRRPREERRGAKRLVPASLTACQIRKVGEDKAYPAWIHNLSKTGVAVLTATEFPVGSKIQIVIINAAHTFALTGEVAVVRCLRVNSGNYLLGGEFTNELQHDEMVPFMV